MKARNHCSNLCLKVVAVKYCEGAVHPDLRWISWMERGDGNEPSKRLNGGANSNRKWNALTTPCPLQILLQP